MSFVELKSISFRSIEFEKSKNENRFYFYFDPKLEIDPKPTTPTTVRTLHDDDEVRC